MQYNLTQHSQVEDNTSIGNVTLSTAQILDIIQTTSANSPALFETDILCLDCDLSARVSIGEIRYYFSSASTSEAVASGIEFYYKNEDFDSYISLPTTIGASYYYTTITSGISAPRYIRLKHTVASGTAVSGTVDGFEVINDDDVVDFGTDGLRTAENFEMALMYDTEEIRTIYLFNDNDSEADAHVIVEPQGTVADEVLSISTSQSGPWYNPVQTSNMIAGTDMWDTGNYLYTEITFDQLAIVTNSGIGTYTTRIFDTMDTQKFTYLNLDKTYPETGMIVATNSDDSQETIEIKSSNTEPMDYITYRKLSAATIGADSHIIYRDRWVYDNSIKFQSSDPMETLGVRGPYDELPRFHIDRNTRKSWALFKWNHKNLNVDKYLTLARCDAAGNVEQTSNLVTDSTGLETFESFSLKGHQDGGVWFYVYHGGTAEDLFNQGQGYYLCHYDFNWNRTLRLYNSDGFVYEMDAVYSTGDLWYSDPVNYQAIKLDGDGNILTTYDFTDDTRGIVATTDGGCWVIQGSKIFNISPTGTLLSEIDLTDTAIDLSRIVWDGDDAFWVTDGIYVRRVLLNGQINFTVSLASFQGTELQAYDTGAAVFCTDRSWRFISRDDRRVIYTLENSTGEEMHIGVEGASYDNLVYANEFPIDFDTTWNALEWNTVSTDYYLMPEDKYNQIRLTLRANESLTSPIVNGLYFNESIQVQNIPAQSYGTMYMKADTTAQDESDSGAYTSNLKTWWYIPV